MKLIRFVAAVCVLCIVAATDVHAAGNTVNDSVVAPIGLFWPNFVAQKKGFFQKAGLDVKLSFVPDVSNETQQVIGGNLDVAYTTCENAIRAIDKGATDLTIVGETVRVYPYEMITRPDIKGPADLKGKKVMLAGKFDLLTFAWNKWLAENGVKPDEVDQVYDGATPNRYAALANGAVAATLVTQPFDFRLLADGNRELMNYSRYMKDFAFVCAVARKSWLKQNPETARAYLKAMSDSIAWLYDPKNKEEAIDILTEVSKQDKGLVAKTYDYFFGDIKPYSQRMAVNVAGLQKVIDALKSRGEIKATWNEKDFVDLSDLPK